MTDAQNCANHCCDKKVNVQTDTYFRCAYCAEPIYCSADCQTIDWAAHAPKCPNIHMGTNVFVPLHDENLSEEVDVADLPETHPLRLPHLLVEHNSDRTMIQQTLTPTAFLGDSFSPRKVAFGTGEAPAKEIRDLRYWVRIRFNDSNEFELTGTIRDDAVHKNSDEDRIRNMLKGTLLHRIKTFFSASDKLILWPRPDASVQDSELPLEGRMVIELDVARASDGSRARVDTIAGNYDVTKFAEASLKQRRFRQAVSLRLQAKQKELKNLFGSGVSMSRLISLGGKSRSGEMTAVVTFEVVGKTGAVFRDIELRMPQNVLRRAAMSRLSQTESDLYNTLRESGVEYQIECDAANPEQSVGMAMALEFRRVQSDSHKFPQEHMDRAAGIIREHARQMMQQNPDYVISSQVHTAFHTAMEEIY